MNKGVKVKPRKAWKNKRKYEFTLFDKTSIIKQKVEAKNPTKGLANLEIWKTNTIL